VRVTSPRPRAVLLVANTAAPYSRALRVGRSLAEDGWEVEIAAVAAPGLPEVEPIGPGLTLRRYRPVGPWARWSGALVGPVRRRGLSRYRLDDPLRYAAWPLRARGWWAGLERACAPADLYHAFGILTIGVALRLAKASRAAGRSGRVVYDVIDVTLESNNREAPRALVPPLRRKERGWAGRADAIVTVNEPIGRHLAEAWGLATPPTVLLNCQPRWDPPAERPDLIRAATGLEPGNRIVLFLGRLGRQRGLEEAAAAVLATPQAALVMLGFGAWADTLRARDTDPAYAGRHFTLPPVHPDAVPAWTASADVSIIAVPANSLNQRLSTPNKFWESLTAGTPVVLGRDLEVMRAIVEADDLGAVADPTDPADLARALREVLDAPPEVRDARRARCLAVCRERYNWETAVRPYLDLIARLSGAAGRPATATTPGAEGGR
jgi:glycosyltransferase involved in cell wall biosynthesis